MESETSDETATSRAAGFFHLQDLIFLTKWLLTSWARTVTPMLGSRGQALHDQRLAALENHCYEEWEIDATAHALLPMTIKDVLKKYYELTQTCPASQYHDASRI